MTQADYGAFMDEFRRLQITLDPYKRLPQETTARAEAYFHVLKKYQLHEVIAKADRWLATEDKFPKPAQWAGVIANRRTVAADVPQMSADDVREYRRAEALHYEDAPCGCPECKTSAVSEKCRRFVPEFNADGTDRKVKDGDRIVTAGHWAHGVELARWYHAKADFYDKFYQALQRTRV